jgi:pyruvate, orthophosphate dikinase
LVSFLTDTRIVRRHLERWCGSAVRPTRRSTDEACRATLWVYRFDEIQDAEEQVGSWDAVRSLLGGKGANLGDMTRLGVPVPPGFTVTTDACKAYLAAGERFPDGMWEQELAALARVEQATGKKFGDAERPLLVSCRSGAKFSMPGMMDTILNIGLNDDVAAGLIRLSSHPRFVYDSYRAWCRCSAPWCSACRTKSSRR